LTDWTVKMLGSQVSSRPWEWVLENFTKHCPNSYCSNITIKC